MGVGRRIVTLERLTRAIEKRFGHPRGEARAEAQRALDYFGFRTRIIDNAIHPDDRKLFYELHDAGLLQSTWETVLLLNGRSWRIFYWEIDESNLDRALDERPAEEAPLYKRLPPEAWGRSPAPT